MNCPPDIAEHRSNPAHNDVENVVRSAMSHARIAQARWSAKPLRERLTHIRELRHLLAEHAITLADASASIRGRPVHESLTAEVLPLAESCRFLEREAPACLAPRRLGRKGLPIWLSGLSTEVHREPFGVVLIIGPGNYPLFLPGVQILQALVAGNAVALKPGAGGSRPANALIELIRRAGVDPDLIQLLPESTDAAIAGIKARPDKVVFTGSARGGESILGQLAPRIIPATMELSGCDAFIVRADADLDLVVKCLKFSLQLNAGATCMAPKRALVHHSVTAELQRRLQQGFPAPEQFARLRPPAPVRDLILGAIAQGAHFVTGGISPEGMIKFPVILGNVDPSSRLLREDVFAPVVSLVSVVDDSDAVAHANDCPYALAASIFSCDESTARKIAKALNAGFVSINDVILPSADPRVPFGGRGRSGFGVTRGVEGLLELTTPKVVSVTRTRFRPALETPHPGDEALFQSYLKFTHARAFGPRVRALLSVIKLISTRNQQPGNNSL